MLMIDREDSSMFKHCKCFTHLSILYVRRGIAVGELWVIAVCRWRHQLCRGRARRCTEGAQSSAGRDSEGCFGRGRSAAEPGRPPVECGRQQARPQDDRGCSGRDGPAHLAGPGRSLRALHPGHGGCTPDSTFFIRSPILVPCSGLQSVPMRGNHPFC